MDKALQHWKNRGSYLKHKEHEIFYVTEGQGECLLFLHGYPFSSYEWEGLLDYFTPTHRVVVLDLLGMGFSDKPAPYVYTYEEQVEIIEHLLAQLNIHTVDIVAHDLGASVAQELLARKNTFAIRSVAFLNGGLFMDVYKPRLIQRLLSQSPNFVGKFLSKVISKQMTFKSVKSVFGPFTQPDDAFMEKQWEILNYNNGKNITYLIGRMIFDKVRYQTRWITAMQQTPIPLCYICGPADPNSGIHMAKRYKELIPNPHVYLLKENIGHWPQVEDLDGVIDAYVRFREEI